MTPDQLADLRTLMDSEPANAGKTAQAVAGWCNAQTERGPVTAAEIIGVILVADTLGPLHRAAGDALPSDAVIDAMALISDRERVLDYADGAVHSKLAGTLDALITESLIGQSTADAILALGENRRSRAEFAGLPKVREQHVVDGRAL